MPVNKRTFVFAATVPASTTDVLEQLLPRDCTIVNCITIFPVGSGANLQVKPLVRNHEGTEENIPAYGLDGSTLSNQFLTGDDTHIDLMTSVPAEKESRLVVRAKNIDAANTHDFWCMITVDFAGGTLRVGG